MIFVKQDYGSLKGNCPVKEINFPKTLNNLGISSLKNPKCYIIKYLYSILFGYECIGRKSESIHLPIFNNVFILSITSNNRYYRKVLQNSTCITIEENMYTVLSSILVVYL